MKKLILAILVFLSVCFVQPKPSAAIVGGVASNISIPGIYVSGRSKTEYKICLVRQLFCGGVAVVIVAVSIFIMGVLIIVKKLHWTTAMIIITGLVIFYNADTVLQMIGNTHASTITFSVNDTDVVTMSSFARTNPLCKCDCTKEITWLNPNSWFNTGDPCQ
jgi:type IV secretory pathway VirB2 component (pilin)